MSFSQASKGGKKVYENMDVSTRNKKVRLQVTLKHKHLRITLALCGLFSWSHKV